MQPIFVPCRSEEAFCKLPSISDLIRTEVNYFKRLEAKLPADFRQELPQHVMVTEGDAAQYIEAMSRFLRSRIAQAPIAGVAPPVAASFAVVKVGAKRRALIEKRYLLRRRKQGLVWPGTRNLR
jgi:hypothetical protein